MRPHGEYILIIEISLINLIEHQNRIIITSSSTNKEAIFRCSRLLWLPGSEGFSTDQAVPPCGQNVSDVLFMFYQ